MEEEIDLIYFDIVFEVDIQAKKNQYGQTKTGRRYKPAHIVETENLALSQIPTEFRGLQLMHPGVEVWFYIPKKSWTMDQDGAYTTALDWLVKAKVIKDDRISCFNGEKFFHPVVESDRKKIIIRLYPDGKIPWCNVNA